MRSFRFASARSFRGSWSAIQSGASSVGPSEHVGGTKIPPCLFAKSPGAAPRVCAGNRISGPIRVQITGSIAFQTVPGAERYLGPDAARARNRHSVSAARCAGRGGIGKDAGSFKVRRIRRCTGRLNATQPGVLAFSPSYIRGSGLACKGSIFEASLHGNTRPFSREFA